jgi:hypothetical protein
MLRVWWWRVVLLLRRNEWLLTTLFINRLKSRVWKSKWHVSCVSIISGGVLMWKEFLVNVLLYSALLNIFKVYRTHLIFVGVILSSLFSIVGFRLVMLARQFVGFNLLFFYLLLSFHLLQLSLFQQTLFNRTHCLFILKINQTFPVDKLMHQISLVELPPTVLNELLVFLLLSVPLPLIKCFHSSVSDWICSLCKNGAPCDFSLCFFFH